MATAILWILRVKGILYSKMDFMGNISLGLFHHVNHITYQRVQSLLIQIENSNYLQRFGAICLGLCCSGRLADWRKPPPALPRLPTELKIFSEVEDFLRMTLRP